MRLKFVFGTRFTEEFASTPDASGDADADTPRCQHEATAGDPKADYRTNPIELCCRRSCAGKGCNCSSRRCCTERSDESRDTTDRHRATQLAYDCVDEKPRSSVGYLADC